MVTATIISVIALVGLALLLVLLPLWQQTRPEAIFRINRVGQTLEEYQARYNAALASIRDLMFDFEMGKVAQEDYEILLAQTKLEAAALRKEIDRLSISLEPDQLDDDLEAEIEILIAQARRNHTAADNADLLPDVEAEIELLKNVHLQPGQPAACPNCGRTYQPDDAFCVGCGQPLPQTDAPALADTAICPHCGFATQADDVFCARCGQSLKSRLEIPASDDV